MTDTTMPTTSSSTGEPARLHRPVWAEVDLGAVRANARSLAQWCGPSQLCAVVKANAYGHGAVPVARAAIEGGATWLAVATVEEGAELRAAGIRAPILLLSEPPTDAFVEVIALDLTPSLYTADAVEAVATAAAGRVEPYPVHVCVDTGMRRVGVSVEDAVSFALSVHRRSTLDLAGLWTHFATSDDLDPTFVDEQLAHFRAVLAALSRQDVRPRIIHAANSAAAVRRPDARFSMVRCGISLYGVLPDMPLADLPLDGRAWADALHAAMSLHARVSFVKRVPAGTGVSYGLRYTTTDETTLATIPVGYADGVPRLLAFRGGEVLLHGKRYPIAGSITMDQLVIDVGNDPVIAGDEVVLIGEQGNDHIDVWEWAERTDTIGYEIVTGIGHRVPRIHR